MSASGLANAKSNLPNHTELMVTVVVDDPWVRKEGVSMDEVKNLLTDSITSSRSPSVSMEISFADLKTTNMSSLGNTNLFKKNIKGQEKVGVILSVHKIHIINSYPRLKLTFTIIAYI